MMSERKKLTALEKRKLLEDGMLPDAITQLEIQLDPVAWAETYLHDPVYSSRPLKVRWYQAEILRSDVKKRAIRAGRRLGKSIALCIDMLWHAFCEEGQRILVCAPFKLQIEQLWKDGFSKLIKGNDYIEASVKSMKANPFLIEFFNGSRILGLTAGSSTGNKGSSIRGQSADRLYMDEVDYMGDDAIYSIMALTLTAENVYFTVSSTPTGKREFFYNACTKKELGYREFFYPSSFSPNWISIEAAKKKKIPLHESHEYLYRNQYPEHVYEHEYEAEWGTEAQGVFKHQHIDASLIEYDPKKEEVDSKGLYWYCGDEQSLGNVYAMGVDWNGDKVGTQIVIVEYCKEKTEVVAKENLSIDSTEYRLVKGDIQGKYRVFYRESVSIKNMTQLESIKRIIDLNHRFKLDHIYVDAGFGSSNIEELKLYGIKNKDSNILTKLKAIDFASHLYIHDPYSKEEVKKAMKPFMVYNAQSCLEKNQLVLPTAEDEKVKLVGQMREYIIEKITPLGVPQFSKENDHILDAFMLALLAFQMEYSELVHVQYSSEVGISKKPTMLVPGLKDITDRDISQEEKPLAKYGIPKRGPLLGADHYMQKSPRIPGNHVDYEDIMKKEPTQSPFALRVARTGWSKTGIPKRSTF